LPIVKKHALGILPSMSEKYTGKLELKPTDAKGLKWVLEADLRAFPQAAVWPAEKHIHALESEGCLHYIFSGEGGGYLGYAVLGGLSESNNAVEILRIVAEPQGKGIGTRALEMLLWHCFSERAAHRVFTAVPQHSRFALQMFESQGFRKEGELRDALFMPNKGFLAVCFYGMLESEYRV